MQDDPYKVLGVSPDASDEEIKLAYRRLARQYHPDRNPGDQEAARKMQQINAAYEQIKNPEKNTQTQTGYDPFRGYYRQTRTETGDSYQQAAAQYIRFRRYREAINALNNAAERNARWYSLSALANDGAGNQVTALEHIRRAVSMEPDNQEYLWTLERMENGGSDYRRQAGDFTGFSMGGDMCGRMCLAYMCCMFSGGRCMFCC